MRWIGSRRYSVTLIIKLEQALVPMLMTLMPLIPTQQLLKKQDRGDIPRTEWLDNLAYRQIEQIHKVMLQRASNAISRKDVEFGPQLPTNF